MKYVRMPIEIESPEQMGYSTIQYNLSESSYTDSIFKNLDLNLNDLVLCYGDHVGHPGLRSEILLNESSKLKPDDVLITAGAASALFIVSTSLLEKDDELIVVKPNYATNIETPRAIGANIKFLNSTFENKYKIDVDQLKSLISAKTKLVSLTYPHNPTGTMVSKEELLEIIKIVESSNAHLLIDETYREMTLASKLPIAASLSDKVISVSSLSKTYGLPGIRVGWLITQNKKLQETFLAAKEQIFICGSIIDEEIAFRYLSKRNEFLPAIKADIANKFSITKAWMNQQKYFEWIEPQGGVVCFPRIKNSIDVNCSMFYQSLLKDFKTYVGPGHWFEENDRSFRLGYGWPNVKELQLGLKALENAMEKSLQ